MADPALFSAFVSPVRVALKAQGFSGSSALFQRSSHDVTHLVQLQRSRYPSPAVMKVRVNLAIWVNALAPVRAGRPEAPSEAGAHWREGIGFLMQPRSDHWLSFSSEAQAQQAGTEASSLLLSAAMPLFDTLSDASAIRNCWRSGSSPGITEFQRVKYLARLEEALARGA